MVVNQYIKSWSTHVHPDTTSPRSCDVSRLHQGRRPPPGPKDIVKFDDFLAEDALILWPVIMILNSLSQECPRSKAEILFLMLVSNSCELCFNLELPLGLFPCWITRVCDGRVLLCIKRPQSCASPKKQMDLSENWGHCCTAVPIKWKCEWRNYEEHKLCFVP